MKEAQSPVFRAAILGAGAMGRAVATLLQHDGVHVRLLGLPEEEAKLRKQMHGVEVVSTMEAACDNVGLVFFAVPAPAVPVVAASYGRYAKGDHVVLHAIRGVSEHFILPHQAIRAETCVRKIGVLGGPLYFDELRKGHALCVVAASHYDEVVTRVKALTDSTQIKVHGSRDVVGVEVAGAIANVTAIAAGMAEALKVGETACGVLLAHGLAEASQIGVRLGADIATFSGLAGVGDLIPRKVASTTRHNDIGAALAKGKSLDAILQGTRGSVEGVVTANAAVELAANLGLELPLISAVHQALQGESDIAALLDDVMARDLLLGSDAAAQARR